jgi:hypothetical protein
MSENTNTSCLVDSGRLITEFETLEFVQAYPSRRNVKLYREEQKKLMSDSLSIEMMSLNSKLESANDEESIAIQQSIIELEAKLSEKYDPAKGINNLILATIEGTKFKKGSFSVDKKEESFTYGDFDDLPEILYSELVKNAIKLITIQKDEEKN